MKLRMYQRFVFLFVLGWCAGTLSLLAQEPVELPEGVARNRNGPTGSICNSWKRS